MANKETCYIFEDKSWSVEMAIPFSDFLGAAHIPPHIGDTWGINFYRYNKVSSYPRKDHIEYSAWSPTFILNFDLLNRFGRIRFVK